jgi:hypothetical protein
MSHFHRNLQQPVREWNEILAGFLPCSAIMWPDPVAASNALANISGL